jgi:hypothetical protein
MGRERSLKRLILKSNPQSKLEQALWALKASNQVDSYIVRGILETGGVCYNLAIKSQFPHANG